MKILLPLVAVLVLAAVGWVGSYLPGLFGIAVPYLALAVFLGGIVWRVVRWARSPVPFRIPTTAGQEKSLPWVKRNRFDNPFTGFEVLVRMALEVLLFRSLFRNTKMELLKEDRRLTYTQEVLLWAGALVFHYSFLVVFLRHFRFFVEPAPFFVPLLQKVDGFLEIREQLPTFYLSGILLLVAALFLFARRIYDRQVRYISLANDYFPLFLIMGIACSGLLMRHVFKVDLLEVKKLVVGILSLHPSLPSSPIGAIFYVHLFLVCTLLAYFPFSKLVHMAGVFMSPTRNLANNNRAFRHVNPWNYPVKVHTYEEWEDEFRELIKECGLPLEKE